MKKLILIFAALFTYSLIQANDCADAVHPLLGNEMIVDCCIEEVKDGNIVQFTKNGETFIMEAHSIIRNGQAHKLSIITKMAPIPNIQFNSLSLHSSESIMGDGINFSMADKHQPKTVSQLYHLENEGPNFFVFNIVSAFQTGYAIWDSGTSNKTKQNFVQRDSPMHMKLSVGKTLHGAGLKFKF